MFNQGANQKRFIHTLPVIITAGLCDTFLITLAVLGVSLIINSLPTLQLIIDSNWPSFFNIYRLLWHEKPSTVKTYKSMSAFIYLSSQSTYNNRYYYGYWYKCFNVSWHRENII